MLEVDRFGVMSIIISIGRLRCSFPKTWDSGLPVLGQRIALDLGRETASLFVCVRVYGGQSH